MARSYNESGHFNYLHSMQVSAKQIADLLNAQIRGDESVLVSKPSKIEEGGAGTITFFGNAKYEQYLYDTTASIVIVPEDFEPKQEIPATQIIVSNVYESLGILLQQFDKSKGGPQGISPLSFLESSFGDDIHIGAYTVVGKNVAINKNSVIYPQCFIGENVVIGKDCKIYPGVRIYADTIIGDHCIIHSNAVIGSDGFGFAPTADGSFKKIEQVGAVILEDHVEIGANTVIDRGSIGDTVIKKGSKLDNLIQIAHNVEIGENTVIAAQAGIAGSTKIGKSCQIGGQAGFVGHITVADGTKVQAQSGIAAAIKEPNKAVYGSPALAYRDYLRAYAVFKNLPDLAKQVKALESKVKDLESQ